METQFPHDQAYYDNNRQWRFATRGNKGQSSSTSRSSCERFEFTLMSYNILAQDLLDRHAGLYAQHNPLALPWAQRYERLIAEIKGVHPDILCVQELQDNHLDQFWNGLANYNYGLLYKKRTGGTKTDGCAIFYRLDLFDLVTHHEVEYFQPNVNKLNRENVAIIAKLSLKSNPETRLVVSTTHLLYNPRRQDVRLAQVQVLLAEIDRLAYSGKLENGVPQYDPIVLCGDFNLQPHSAPYQLLLERYLRYDHLVSRTLELEGYGCWEPTGKHFLPQSLGITDRCQHYTLKNRKRVQEGVSVPSSELTKLHHSNTLRSSTAAPTMTNEDCSVEQGKNFDSPSRLRNDSKRSPEREFSSGSLSHQFAFESAYQHDSTRSEGATTFQDEWITVDYLFYTPYRSVAECNYKLPNWNLELLGTYALPTLQQCSWHIGHIPNLFYGSDHFSLAGRFLLTTTKRKK